MVFDISVIFILFCTLYFEVFLLVTFFEGGFRFSKPHTKRPEGALLPSVSIVVPAWNEEKTLSGTMNSLLALDYPKDLLSIIIVDDGSTDNTLAEARKFEIHPNVMVLTKENGGKHTAMNLAIERTKSELIGCLDADSFVEPNALMEIVAYFQDETVMAVTPSVQIWKPDNPLRRLQAVEYMIGEFTRKMFAEIGGLYVTPGPFSIYRKNVFDKIGLFVQGYHTEDMEMAMRMQSHRMRIENAHTAYVHTVSPGTARALYKQRVRWVTGFLKNCIYGYRHMLFSPRHGNLGMLTLPFALISIFIGLFFSALYFKEIAHAIYLEYLRYSALGFHFDLGIPHFDWFSLNLEFSRIIIYLLFAITVTFIMLGIKIVLNKVVFSRNILYFLALYGFIAPIWLAKSVFNLVVAKDAPWR